MKPIFWDSKSTDKLYILCETVREIPKEVLQNLKSFSLDWREINGTIIPNLKIEFKS